MQRRIAVLSLFVCLFCTQGWSNPPEIGGSQNLTEKEIQSVVRNKRYYKAGKLELAGAVGLLPYDSMYNQYTLGGRLVWHISDHYSWEIVDFFHSFASVSSFTTSLASDATKQLVDVEGLAMNNALGTTFLMSPFYGKIRFFGQQVAFLDIYIALGLGAVNTTTTKYAYSPAAPGYTTGAVAQGWNPSLNYGVGFKFFMNNSFSLFFDIRNYMSYSPVYGTKILWSNLAITGGFSFFLPGFG